MAEDATTFAAYQPNGSVQVIAPFDESAQAALEAYREQQGELVAQWMEEFNAAGDYTPPVTEGTLENFYRAPTLTVPKDFYTQVRWAREYHEQEGLVNSLMERDINSAIKPVEFNLPEDEGEEALGVLEKWRRKVNRSIGHHGGLNAYNRALATNVLLAGLTITLLNWGPMKHKGKFYRMPMVLVDLDPLAIVPDINTLTGEKEYYLKLSQTQAEAIKAGTATGFLQIIPDAASRIVDDIDFIVKKIKALNYGWDPRFLSSGPYLKLPIEDGFVIAFNCLPQDRWPKPSLLPIFGAIAMKRKLQLADWHVADGLVNMLMIWSFPIGTKPKDAKKIVNKFIAGGRVQSHAVPDGVKVEVITPPLDILDSAEKFWVPVSEIMSHFDFPLNSRSRGAGDLDSGPLDLASNKARLDNVRDVIEGHNNWLTELIAEKNNWDFDVLVELPAKDLDETDAFRSFILTLFDRGGLSWKTLLEKAGSSVEKEVARRKKEAEDKVDDTLEIRETFKQSVGPDSSGRTPDANNPNKTKPGSEGKGVNDKQTRNTRNRATPSSQNQTGGGKK